MNKDREKQLAAIFRDKPEMVIPHPGPLLTPKQVETYRQTEDFAIVEIAGRDSVAAAVCACERHGYGNLLPVYAYTGSEHGPWRNVGEAVSRLARRLPKVRLHPLLVVGSPRFWHALNGRFIPDLFESFGHYTPCTGCHLYLHAIRIPLARMLGNAPIIAGERKSHGGSLKINQVAEALEFYHRFAAGFGIFLHLPLADITDNGPIEEILRMPWEQGEDQLGCVLSGNYKRSTGGLSADIPAVTRYFNQFAGPVADAVIRAYLENRLPDHEAITRQVVARCLASRQPPISPDETKNITRSGSDSE